MLGAEAKGHPHPSVLDAICEHDYGGDPLLPYHAPEVTERGRQRSLSCDELLLLLAALGRREVLHQFISTYTQKHLLVFKKIIVVLLKKRCMLCSRLPWSKRSVALRLRRSQQNNCFRKAEQCLLMRLHVD